MSDYTPPTTDEIHRVAEYWRRAKIIACEHNAGFRFTSDYDGFVCRECDQPIRFYSDTQIEQMRKHTPYDDVRDAIIPQLKRGGVRVEVDGQWHDLRFLAYRLPGWAGDIADSEIAVMKVTDVELMLNATDAR